MIPFRTALLCLLCCAVAPAEEAPPQAVPVDETPELVPVPQGGNVPRPEPVAQAVSQSRMFSVKGGDGVQRSSVALSLEQHKNAFHQLLGEEPDNFPVPFVVVELVAEAQDGGFASALVLPEGSRPVLNVRMAAGEGGVDREILERLAFTAILYERALRAGGDEEFDERLIVRPWLVEGLSEARKWREGGADRRLYEGVFRRGGGFTLDELFELSERSHQRLDTASRLAFRALSGALLMALIEQPKGDVAFRGFCAEAARFAGEMPVLLRKHFPELNLSERSLAKWWALTLAKLVQPTLTEVLPVLETERQLTEALSFPTRDENDGAVRLGIDGWPEIVAMEALERRESLRPAEDALVRLSYRCFPSYRPLIQEYQTILRDLAEGKDRDIGARLASLAEQRLVRQQRAIRARDYLDYFEISRARDLSGEFEDYMRLKKELELRPRPKRTDPLTEKLDTLQQVFEPKSRRP
jgi:hypothetical protein